MLQVAPQKYARLLVNNMETLEIPAQHGLLEVLDAAAVLSGSTAAARERSTIVVDLGFALYGMAEIVRQANLGLSTSAGQSHLAHEIVRRLQSWHLAELIEHSCCNVELVFEGYGGKLSAKDRTIINDCAVSRVTVALCVSVWVCSHAGVCSFVLLQSLLLLVLCTQFSTVHTVSMIAWYACMSRWARWLRRLATW